jgi:hypothetical protein
LVGFAFRPGAPLLFHALGAWLAELLPVTLWYFFDEAGLRRCERHTEEGARFQEQCDVCERLALSGMRRSGPADAAIMRAGSAFLERELAALARSRRLGRPEGTRFASIDLASDGLAYAHAHGPRLRAPAMERYVAQFFGADQGWHATLDGLEARVCEVHEALTRRRAIAPWKATRWDYAAQDVGYRPADLDARFGSCPKASLRPAPEPTKRWDENERRACTRSAFEILPNASPSAVASRSS